MFGNSSVSKDKRFKNFAFIRQRANRTRLSYYKNLFKIKNQIKIKIKIMYGVHFGAV